MLYAVGRCSRGGGRVCLIRFNSHSERGSRIDRDATPSSSRRSTRSRAEPSPAGRRVCRSILSPNAHERIRWWRKIDMIKGATRDATVDRADSIAPARRWIRERIEAEASTSLSVSWSLLKNRIRESERRVELQNDSCGWESSRQLLPRECEPRDRRDSFWTRRFSLSRLSCSLQRISRDINYTRGSFRLVSRCTRRNATQRSAVQHNARLFARVIIVLIIWSSERWPSGAYESAVAPGSRCVSSGLRNQIFALLELRLGLHGEARGS